MRRKLVSPPEPVDFVTTTYQVWLNNDQYDAARELVAQAGLSWPVWFDRAFKSFSSLEEEEITNFMASWSRSREGKRPLSMRIHASTLEQCREMAKKYKGSVQRVIAHAVFVQVLKESASELMSRNT